MAGISICNLGEDYSWGSRVEGVNWDNLYDDQLRTDLRELFDDRGFIIFEGMEPSPKMQVELSKVFGPLKDHPTKSTARADRDLDPGIIDMQHIRTADQTYTNGLTEVGGKKVISFLPWHFDHTYNDELNYAGVLRAVVYAPEDGRTGFADGIELYNALDPKLIRKIEDLNVLYTLDVRLTQQRFGRYFETFGDTEDSAGLIAEAATFPRSIHPMIWTRPGGEKVVHYCGFSAVGIEDHEDPEGEALFEEALEEMHKHINPYWHDWKPTDMLIWDNLRLLHAVEGCDPKYERRMHRTTIRGDYGLGSFEDGKKIGEVQREVAPLDLPA
ncbi:MAG: TauD/TfdA family dioxygenase [Novosphingobium sp.]|nr:TauD/TfdA family dioxygenase [Novosphingobium sp.]